MKPITAALEQLASEGPLPILDGEDISGQLRAEQERITTELDSQFPAETAGFSVADVETLFMQGVDAQAKLAAIKNSALHDTAAELRRAVQTAPVPQVIAKVALTEVDLQVKRIEFKLEELKKDKVIDPPVPITMLDLNDLISTQEDIGFSI